eukprot:snap_masked-scaffold_51-processed-gene-1.21-mRNA-1 protein AED:0.34 eAED:0.38 QI:0/-1/0/1/-1/1/1/0/1241
MLKVNGLTTTNPSFYKRKEKRLNNLQSNTNDKSPKGSVDIPIVPLVNTINSIPKYSTTSSCSGRVSIFLSSSEDKKSGKWLLVSHDPVSEISRHLLNTIEAETEGDSSDVDIFFKFEPFLMHVECVDEESARCLLRIALECGFRESGIIIGNSGKFMVGIRTQGNRLEVPLVLNAKSLITEKYLFSLLEEANQRFMKNTEHYNLFHDKLISFFQSVDSKVVNFPQLVKRKQLTSEVLQNLKRYGHQVVSLPGMFVCHGGFGASIITSKLDKTPQKRLNELFVWSTDHDKLLLSTNLGTTDLELALIKHSLGYLPKTQTCIGFGGRAGPLKPSNGIFTLCFHSTTVEKVKESLRILFFKDLCARWSHTGSEVLVIDGIEHLIIFGGRTLKKCFNDVHALYFDETERTVKKRRIMVKGKKPKERFSHAAVVMDNKLLIYGGYNHQNPNFTKQYGAMNDVFTLSVEKEDSGDTVLKWKELRTRCSKRLPFIYGHSLVVYNNGIIVLGGTRFPFSFNPYFLLNFDKNTVQMFENKELHGSANPELLPLRTGFNKLGSKQLLSIGGGSLCFSFGFHFNQSMEFKISEREFISKSKVGTSEKTRTILEELLLGPLREFVKDSSFIPSIPKSVERVNDVVMFKDGDGFTALLKCFGFNDYLNRSGILRKYVFPAIAKELECQKVVLIKNISPMEKDILRKSRAVQLHPYIPDEEEISCIVTVRQNNVTYKYDMLKVMFSKGNLTEKIRVGNLVKERPNQSELIVDLYAGIGYFSLQYLKHGGEAIQHMYLCEMNPISVKFLKENLEINCIPTNKYTILEGDNNVTIPKIFLDGTGPKVTRVNMGLIPSCEASFGLLPFIINDKRNLEYENKAMLHVHMNWNKVEYSQKEMLGEWIVNTLIICFNNKRVQLNVENIVKVKNYAPKIEHLVFDVSVYFSANTSNVFCDTGSNLESELYPASKYGRILTKPKLFHGAFVSNFEKLKINVLNDEEMVKLKEREVSIHVSKDAKCNLSFKPNNFKYELVQFGDFLDKVAENEGYYMRSLAPGKDFRKRPANFFSDFYALLQKNLINFHSKPSQFPFCSEECIFSSVLRISSRRLSLWAHYDVYDNILYQLAGSKTITLFNRDDFDAIRSLEFGMGGTSDNTHDLNLKGGEEVNLKAGHALFIPAFWPHKITNGDATSISLNIFFKNNEVDEDLFSKKDIFGNQDPRPLLPVEKDVKRIKDAIESLPKKYRRFFKNKIAAHILS